MTFENNSFKDSNNKNDAYKYHIYTRDYPSMQIKRGLVGSSNYSVQIQFVLGCEDL